MYTLIVAAKLNDVDPQAWLADVLARIAEPATHRPAVEPGKAAGDGAVLGKGAVAGERDIVLEMLLDLLQRMRPFGMAGDLHLLPRRQLGVGGAHHAPLSPACA